MGDPAGGVRADRAGDLLAGVDADPRRRPRLQLGRAVAILGRPGVPGPRRRAGRASYLEPLRPSRLPLPLRSAERLALSADLDPRRARPRLRRRLVAGRAEDHAPPLVVGPRRVRLA